MNDENKYSTTDIERPTPNTGKTEAQADTEEPCVPRLSSQNI